MWYWAYWLVSLLLIGGPALTGNYGHTLYTKNGALVKNEIRYKYLFISLPFWVTQILLSNKKCHA